MGAALQSGDPRQIGRYRVVDVLGEGGMGRVYLGRSAGGQQVAVKMIRRELADDPQFRARFKREVDAACRVNGLYTAHVVDADTEAREPWLATAYINAPSLATKVGEGGPLPDSEVRQLAAALAEGLSEIHAVGLVHRDLKPANVLLASDGPRIIDFGIARFLESDALTRSGSIVGTPSYMSPEQARGGEVGPPSDVFSLGAVIYFAAIGAAPWGHGSTEAMIYRVVHEQPKLTPLPAGIRWIVARCLAKEPQERLGPSDITALLGDSDMLGGSRAAPPRTTQDRPARPRIAPDPSVEPGPVAGWSTESLIPVADIQEVLKSPPPEPVQANPVAPPARGAYATVRKDGSALNFALPTAFVVVIAAIAVIAWFINPVFAICVYVIGVVLIIYGALKYFWD